MNIEIKIVPLNEVDQLQKIAKQTFFDSFSAGNTEENMNLYLKEEFSKDKLISELKDFNSRTYFAKLDNKVIGYLKINFGPSQTDLKDGKAIEIERIYVTKKYQGKGVGQLLFQKTVQLAKDKKADYIWLGVWEENLKAIQFYKKNGFVEFDKHIFKLGNDKQTDIMMKLKLNY